MLKSLSTDASLQYLLTSLSRSVQEQSSDVTLLLLSVLKEFLLVAGEDSNSKSLKSEAVQKLLSSKSEVEFILSLLETYGQVW